MNKWCGGVEIYIPTVLATEVGGGGEVRAMVEDSS